MEASQDRQQDCEGGEDNERRSCRLSESIAANHWRWFGPAISSELGCTLCFEMLGGIALGSTESRVSPFHP